MINAMTPPLEDQRQPPPRPLPKASIYNTLQTRNGDQALLQQLMSNTHSLFATAPPGDSANKSRDDSVDLEAIEKSKSLLKLLGKQDKDETESKK